MKCDLKLFKCSLPSTTYLSEDASFVDENFVFQVLGLYCYLGDATYLSSLPNSLKAECEGPIYLYDVVITDGSYKQKCLLRPDLASLVQKKILEVGSQIHVRHAILQQHERDHIVVPYIILCKIDIKGHFPFPDPSKIPFLPSKNKKESEPCPLVTGRQYYLNTWLMNIPYKIATADLLKFDKDTHELSQPLVTLKNLSVEWKSLPRPYPPLLVTVLLQGKLHHFGKNTIDCGYPFQGYIEVGDDTGICSAVFWQSSNVNFFTSTQPGTILLLQNYNVIPKYPRIGTPIIRHTLQDLEHFNLEIKVNKTTEVYFVDSAQVAEIAQQEIHLPLPQYWFATRDVLGQLPPETNVDVIGLVTYVGRYIREPCLVKNGSRKGGFWVYRWIELIDGTSPLPIILQIYINSQENLQSKLKPGQILVCSQLLVACVPLYVTKSRQRRLFYLTTTSESRLIICNEQSLANEKEYKRLNQLLKDKDQDVAHLQSSVYRVGGYYHFPLCQLSLETFQLAFTEERPFQVTPCLAWKKIVTELSYKEYRRIAIVGTIIQVEFVELKSNEDGWIKGPYRRKHHCLFLDVCRKQNAKFQETIGINSFCADVFAHQYKEENEQLLQSWLSFAPFSADEQHKEYTEDEMIEIPVLCNGYYCIDIAGVQPSYIIRAMMFPPPSHHPHPGLLKLLSGNYRQLQNELVGNLCTKPAKYVESEIKYVRKTAQEIGGMKFICVLDLYCHSVGKVEIVLKRAFSQGTEDNQCES